MSHPVVGSKLPPNIFNNLDDDEDRNLKRIFHAVYDPEKPLDVDIAATQIDSYYPVYSEKQHSELQRKHDAGEEKTLKNPQNTVWWILSDFFVPLAKQLPFDDLPAQQRLVDLLKTLAALPPKPAWSCPAGGHNVWTMSDYADLSNTVQYEYNGESCIAVLLALWCTLSPLLQIFWLIRPGGLFTAASESPANVAAQQEARNFNAWIALLHVQGVGDHSLYAIWCIRRALEEDEVKVGPALEYRVPRAVDWIQRAGRQLSTCDKEYGRAGSGKELWQGRSGFSQERWAFWKSRLFLMGVKSSLSQPVRDSASTAAKIIDWVDSALNELY